MDTHTPQALLREIKAATGWSQSRIAKESGTTQPTINRIANGKVDCLASTQRALCELYEKVRAEPKRPRRSPPKVPA